MEPIEAEASCYITSAFLSAVWCLNSLAQFNARLTMKLCAKVG